MNFLNPFLWTTSRPKADHSLFSEGLLIQEFFVFPNISPPLINPSRRSLGPSLGGGGRIFWGVFFDGWGWGLRVDKVEWGCRCILGGDFLTLSRRLWANRRWQKRGGVWTTRHDTYSCWIVFMGVFVSKKSRTYLRHHASIFHFLLAAVGTPTSSHGRCLCVDSLKLVTNLMAPIYCQFIRCCCLLLEGFPPFV